MAHGLAAFELELLAFASDALDACGRPVPSEQHLYHGPPVVACCTDDGLMTVHWQAVTPERTGIPQDVGNPPGKPRADIRLRLYRCFPEPNDDGTWPGGETAASTGLALDLECLWWAISDAICNRTLTAELAGCDDLQLVDASPRPPLGGCAGIELHLTAGWKAWDGNP